MKHRRRWLRGLLALVTGLVVSFAAGEIVVRIVLWARHKPFDGDFARAAALLDISKAEDFVPRLVAKDEAPADQHAQERFLHPYFGWEIHGGLDLLNAEAKRMDDPSTQKDYEVLLVGGSVSAVFGHLGWPFFLQRIRSDPRLVGREIHLMPFAHGAFKEPQTIFLVQYMLAAGFTPECVINIDGFNDVALANDNAARGVSPIMPAVPQWANLATNSTANKDTILLASRILEEQRSIAHWGRFLVESGLYRSALVHTLVIRRMRALQDRVNHDNETHLSLVRTLNERVVLRGPPFKIDGSDAVQKAVRAWSECSRSLQALCESRGISYFQALQPTLYDEDAKPFSGEETEQCPIISTWREGVRAGYPLMREEGRRLATNGLNFVDASRVFEQETQTLYYDNCHFGETGNRIFAEFLAHEFLKRMPAPR